MPRRLFWTGCVLAVVLLLAAWPSDPVAAKSPDSAPPLPAPGGTVVNVSTVSALQAAVASLQSNRTIVIAPGTYHLTSTLWINGNYSNVTIRGATNNRDDVVLVGKGMTTPTDAVPFGIWSGGNVTNLTIANLTIRDIYQHPILFNAGTQAPRVYNVRLLDAGDQFIKANPGGTAGGVHNGIVEYSVIEHTTNAPDDYTNGVDVHSGRDWIVRHNLFRRIRAASGLAGPALLMWNGSSGTIADGNTFVDCQREISFGLITRSPNDHSGGVIRNNFIMRSAGVSGDVGIAVFDSPGTQVVHNTIFLSGGYPSSIEYRFPDTTGVLITNNLGDRPASARDGASGSQSGNVWTATSSWFANAAAGDLHLKSTSTGAIDRGTPTVAAPADWDDQSRPAGAAPDAGADEYVASTPPPPPADTTPPSVSITSPTGGTVSGQITVTATATDNVGVTSVWFLLDGTNVGGEDTSPPYQVSWNTTTATNGSHSLRAFARDAAGNAAGSATVTVTVNNSSPPPPPPPPPSPGIIVTIDGPAAGQSVRPPFTLTGWAIDTRSTSGPGIMFLQAWAVPHQAGRVPLYLGWVAPQTSRTDVAQVYGSRFRDSGFSVPLSNVPPGAYTLAFFPYSLVVSNFDYDKVATVPVNVLAGAVTTIDTPAWGQVYGNRGIAMTITGWAVDSRVTSGTGIDAVHVWAVNAQNGNGSYLGTATLGLASPEAAALLGSSRFAAAGYRLVNPVALVPGVYYILVTSHSTGGAFNVTKISAAVVQ